MQQITNGIIAPLEQPLSNKMMETTYSSIGATFY